MAMKLNVGKIAFPIEFDNGDKDCIYFNPNDPDLASRLMNAKDNIEKRLKDLKPEEFSLLNDGNVDLGKQDNYTGELSLEQKSAIIKKAEQMTNLLNNTKNIIFEELDRAFDSNVSSVVFKHCSPFAIVNGEYFFAQFLNAITPEIRKHISKSNENIAKHINKYKK